MPGVCAVAAVVYVRVAGVRLVVDWGLPAVKTVIVVVVDRFAGVHVLVGLHVTLLSS
jgi:hypothetical protein